MNEESNEAEVELFVMGKKYRVPSGLTIMKAMEYVGYQFIRGAGCRGGFCGACSTVYRTQDDYQLKMDLACQKTIEDGMYLVQIPFTPAVKKRYDLSTLPSSGTVILNLYPEIARCMSCNTCTKACPQDLDVMDFVQAALRGDLKEVAALSFDCIQCGLCAMRCPVNIVPYNVAQLARRLHGRISPPSKHVIDRVKEIESGVFDAEVADLLCM
ncbi:MAG: 4Fe-4S dicluster domain-containing protein [Candidatus Bathyarchaeota archaeon]|nr:MAG: 4Fe-4S dicluster domain-containing protein [Candidatus Bathyarchaeota archaeon]